MKYILFFSFLNFFCQTSWEEFISLSGRFKILTPGPLMEQVDSIETQVGKIAYHTYFHQTEENRKKGHQIYMVSFCDYPEGIIFADSTGLVGEFFDETMQAASEVVEGEVVYSTDIQLEENPGRFWRIDYLEGNAIIKTKAYVVGNRYYSVQVITTKVQNKTELNNQFLDSFELL